MTARSTPGNQIKCPKCGTLNPAGYMICRKCRIRFASASESVHAPGKFALPIQLSRKLAVWFIPRYNELTTYLIALTYIVVFASYQDFRKIVISLLQDRSIRGEDIMLIITLVFVVVSGFTLSIFHVFFKGKKSAAAKYSMVAFALVTNGWVSIVAGIELITRESSILLIFPLANIVIGVLYLYQIGFLDEIVMVDDNASLLQVITASISLLIVFATAYYVFNFSWQTSFSFCIVFTSLIPWALSVLTPILKTLVNTDG